MRTSRRVSRAKQVGRVVADRERPAPPDRRRRRDRCRRRNSARARRACPCRAGSSRSLRPGLSGSGSLSLPWPCASRSRKSTAARVQASARSLSRRTVVAVSASPARSASAIRKCASRFSRRSAVIRLISRRRLRRRRRLRDLRPMIAVSRSSTGWSKSASRISGRRRGAVAQEGGEVEDGGEEIRQPRPCRARNVGQPRQARPSRAAAAISASSCARGLPVERRQLRDRLLRTSRFRRRRAPRPPSSTGPPVSGKLMTTDKPGLPGSRSSRPSWNFMTALARLRPRPEPGCERLFSSRTKRSVARARSASSGMPGPLSATASLISPSRPLERHAHRRLRRWHRPNI